MQNIPEVKLGIIAVSRDCFPIGLSTARREAIVKAYGADVYNCTITVENELDAQKAVADVIEIGRKAKPESDKKLTRLQRERMIEELTAEMREAARTLEFEKAAYIRDRIKELKNTK